jgi:predicted nucleotidyltransferase
MNAPLIHRAILRRHIEIVEAKHPLRVLGLLPRGSAAHVSGEQAIDLLAEKRPGLDLLGLCEAEAQLSELLGRPVGIVLRSGLTGEEAVEVLESVEPL